MKYKTDGLVGKSRQAKKLREEIEKLSKYSCSVLILGETGTGKELVGKLIHEKSGRGNFVALSCSSLPDSLLESQLFGHERGTFTGAVRQYKGFLERAHKGTLFLDEIGVANQHFQERLLRVLQEHQFERLGGYYAVSSDFRLITATNRDLIEAIAEGDFREDLYYRINTVSLEIPPLRERREDIPELSQYFLEVYGEKYSKPRLELSEEARDALVDYYWPGNVRELQHTIERAVIDAGRTIKAEHLHLPNASFHELKRWSGNGYRFADAVAEFEKGYLEEALSRNNGGISRTAREIGVSRKAVYQKVEKYGIDVAAYRNGRG